MMLPSSIRKWLAIGSGLGIQITGPKGSESLRISAVRVRPGGAQVRGGFTIEDFMHQPAGAWGADFAAFLSKLRLRDTTAAVLLPRHDVIVRPLSLPGVSGKDLESAVRFQLDGLHPYNEEDVYFSWSRLPGTSTVLVAVARRDAVDRYSALFSEAGIKIGAFSCSAAAVYSAMRLFEPPPTAEFLAWDNSSPGMVEMYGESGAHPIFSASFDTDPDRASSLALAAMRSDPRTAAVPLATLLEADPPLPYAAAVLSACPRLSLPLNLLPPDRRAFSSPLRWVPTAALSVAALMLASAFAALPSYERRHYMGSLNTQIAQVTTAAATSNQLDKDIDAVRRRTDFLDNFRRRAKSDMDALAELTKILPPPTWLNLTEISERQVMIAGETDQAEPLLKVLDASPLFDGSEFQGAPLRNPAGGWVFRIRTNRESSTREGAGRP
jgi:Tfp pilus assembly protein PilN